MPNSAQVIINPGLSGTVTCTSHALYHQKVVLSFVREGGGVAIYTFTGQGENKPMPGTDAPNGTLTFPPSGLPSENKKMTVKATFSHSADNGKTWVDSNGRSSVQINTDGSQEYILQSEDSTDNDNNDSVVRIVVK